MPKRRVSKGLKSFNPGLFADLKGFEAEDYRKIRKEMDEGISQIRDMDLLADNSKESEREEQAKSVSSSLNSESEDEHEDAD